MTTQIKSTVPVLASLNLAESVAFYTDLLGFTTINLHDDYAMVVRDNAEIHFWACADRNVARNTSCYVRVADTQSLFEEFSGKGVAVKKPEVRAWGMKELYVIDPHGNLLKFGEPV